MKERTGPAGARRGAGAAVAALLLLGFLAAPAGVAPGAGSPRAGPTAKAADGVGLEPIGWARGRRGNTRFAVPGLVDTPRGRV
jgi:hypothetical protein